MSQEQLDQKSRKWQNVQGRRFGAARKTAYVDTGKQSLPPEHIRKILKDHGDMSNRCVTTPARWSASALFWARVSASR